MGGTIHAASPPFPHFTSAHFVTCPAFPWVPHRPDGALARAQHQPGPRGRGSAAIRGDLMRSGLLVGAAMAPRYHSQLQHPRRARHQH